MLRKSYVYLIAIVLFLVLGLGFVAVGSAHRDRCLKAGNVGCTLMPWSGHRSGGYVLGSDGWGP